MRAQSAAPNARTAIRDRYVAPSSSSTSAVTTLLEMVSDRT